MAHDRISELPDPIIHHILSFLPSTKQAIRTGILSKRWRKQWTQVPALIFDSSTMIPKNFLTFHDKTLTLHQNPKINAFHLNYNGRRGTFRKYPQIEEKIRFATAKHVEDLSLSCSGCEDRYLVPEFLFDNDTLVKLSFGSCETVPSGKVNWASLKELKLKDCMLIERAMDYVLSGCPLLEFLELADCAVSDSVVDEEVYNDCRFQNLVISSTSLKKLALEDLKIDVLEISCPSLEELSMKRLSNDDPKLFDEAIENALSNCPLLETFMLIEFHSLSQPVIASPSLRRLVLSNILSVDGFKIACQKLEELEIKTLDRCYLSDERLGYVVSGSPLLESLELTNRDGLAIIITTESLKKLVFKDLCVDILEISCPNLEELSLKGLKTDDPKLLGQVIENVLSNSLSLESLTVHNCPQLRLPVIDSQSLKRLVISNIDRGVDSFEMSCQKLEELTLSGFINVMNVNFGNVPSLLCATLDFFSHHSTDESRNSFFKDILQQLQHIKELTLRRSFFGGLRLSEASFPILHIKCLNLDSFHWIINLKTVAFILRNCSILETLVVKLFFNDPYIGDVPKLGGFEENYWSSNAVGPSCLVSHLKNVKI